MPPEFFKVWCSACGWKTDRILTAEDLQHFKGHRCRDCLERDPNSKKLFDYAPVSMKFH